MLSKLEFWQQRQLYQSFEPTREVMGLLPATLLLCLVTKRAQNQEKRAILINFRSFFANAQ